MQIIQYWDTVTIPNEIEILIDSFRKNNPCYSHVLFNKASAAAFIAEHFSNREVAAFQACAVPAMQADYFRYCAVFAQGGVYADADMCCLQNLRPLVDRVESAEFFERPGKDVITNGFFVVRSPRHPFLRCALEIATDNIERRTFSDVWSCTGPGILTALYWLSNESLLEELRSPGADIHALRLISTAENHVGGNISDIIRHVRFSTLLEADQYAKNVSASYKKSGTHWVNWQGSIFQ